MAHPQIAAFARLANGAATATRAIEGQTTLLGRTMHSISYDELHDEIVVPQQFGQAILTFRGGASGEEKPIRVIQGSLTQLKAPDRLAVDPVHDEIFVPNGDSVLVFPREGQGNIAPIRVLRGPDTLLGAKAVAVDPVRDLLIVASGGDRDQGTAPGLLIFNRTDQGNVKPLRVISGPRTGLTNARNLQIAPAGWIVLGGPDDEETSPEDSAFVGIWSINDRGDVPPRWTIGGPNGILKAPRGVTLDPKNETVILSDKLLNAILTFSVPEIY